MFRKSAFTVILTLLLILGLAATSFANPGNANKGWKFKDKGKGNAVQLIDISKHWAEQPIREMCSRGIISGYPDKKYIPNAPVSKYEALMMVCRAAGFDPDPDKSWEQKCEDCIEFALDEGILDEDDDFAGWKPAKRYEVAVWSIRAMSLDEDGDGLSFQDIDEIPADALPFISVMFKHKYMVGYPGNFFQPNRPVTRAEMAMILYRMMGDYDYDDDSDFRLSSLDPGDGEDNVDPDTNVLVARFNMNIEAVDDLQGVKEGIRVKNVTDDDYVDIDSVSIDGSKLTIELDDSLVNDCKYRVTIEQDIIESEDSEESFDGISGSEWEFSTFDERDINLTNLNPDDGDSKVDTDTDQLVATFNMDIKAVEGLQEVKEGIKVKNVTDGDYVDIYSVSIDGSELTIELDDSLESDCLYRVTIEQDIIESDDSAGYFDGISGSEWEFSTFEDNELDLNSLDPEDGDSNVDPDTNVLRATFNNDISVISGRSLLDVVKVYNVDRNRYEDINEVEIEDGDTLVVTLEGDLGTEDTFEVTIRPGFLEDDNSGEDYDGLAGDNWRFTTD